MNTPRKGLAAGSGRLPAAATLATRVGIAALALLLGLVVATGNPIVISVALAAIVGLALISKPTWLVWIYLTLGLLVIGVVPLWADAAASRAVWGVSVLGFTLMLIAFFYTASVDGATNRTPGFVWMCLAFLIFSVLNGALRSDSVAELVGGVKRYFHAFGLIFFLAWVPVGDNTISRWRRFFVLVALTQIPWAVYQLLILVPVRTSLEYAYKGMVPIDVVAGTFGSTLTGGGGSAEMAAFLVIVLGFLLARSREGAISIYRLCWLMPLVVAPLFMGETKIILFALPLMLLTVYGTDLLARPVRGLAALLIGALVVVLLGLVYANIIGSSFEQAVENTIAYNFRDVGYYGGYSLNRTTVLTFWLKNQGLEDPVSAVFGHGLGSANDSRLNPGYLGRRYAGMGIGLTAASTLLWEQGVFGLLLFLAILVLAWRSASRLIRISDTAWVRADAVAIKAGLCIFFLWTFYRVTLLEMVTIQIIYAILLGYLAWLHRMSNTIQAGKI